MLGSLNNEGESGTQGTRFYSQGDPEASAKRVLLAFKAINAEGWGKGKHLVRTAQGFPSPPTLSGCNLHIAALLRLPTGLRPPHGQRAR